uniref:Uncharacterized protein LOC111108203 n=1 Tax=Crassostrea virginica TaxID=6565 RepID=A0A8B8B8V6_CRAVI|nr:uncharacterized protein LOC111108203 [Crassostrea virginica]
MYVVLICLLGLLSSAIVHSQQTNPQTSPMPFCSRASSRMIDNAYQAAYQRGYDNGFNSAAANYGESGCSKGTTEDPCKEATDRALAEATRQAKANRQMRPLIHRRRNLYLI